MSTPPPPEIVIGETWVLPNDLGVGLGAIPAGAEVEIIDLLPPYSPGVAQVDETTVVANYVFTDWIYDETGNLVEAENTRRLAYPESTFRLMFEPLGGA